MKKSEIFLILTFISVVIHANIANAKNNLTIDPNYIKYFANRPLASLNKKQFFIFKNSELGGMIGCYSWGCYKNGTPLIGKKVVVIGRYLNSWAAHGGEPDIYQLEAESGADTVMGVFKGTPPPIGQASPTIKNHIDQISKKLGCGNGGVTYCTGVFWGTVKYNPNPRYVLRFTRSDYYCIDIEGVNLYSKYNAITDASIEGAKYGAKFGLSKAFSMIVDSGFKIDE